MDFDTITSISTPMGEGAIGIVRLSGPQAIEIGDILYKGKKKLSEVETHTINYGHIMIQKQMKQLKKLWCLFYVPLKLSHEKILLR